MDDLNLELLHAKLDFIASGVMIDATNSKSQYKELKEDYDRMVQRIKERHG